MSKFVTQTDEGSVTVLVFAKPSFVLATFQDRLIEKGIAVEVIDPSYLSEGKRKQLHQESFYKLIWILDDTQKGTPEADHVFQFLFSRDEPQLILTATISNNGITPKWREKREADDQLFHHLRTYLPHAYIQISTNWLDQPELFVSPFAFIDPSEVDQWREGGMKTDDVLGPFLHALSRPHISGVETIQLEQEFPIRDMVGWFDRAQPQRSLIEPVRKIKAEKLHLEKKTPSSSTPQAKHTHPSTPKRLHIHTEKQVVPEVKAPKLPHPKIFSKAATSQQVKAEAQAKKASEIWQTIGHNSRHIHVVPHATPVIGNRQQAYEQSIGKIRQRFDVQKKLRPLPVQVQERLETQPKMPQQMLQPLEQRLELNIQQLFGSQRQEQRSHRLEEKVVKTVKTRTKVRRQKVFGRGMGVLAIIVFLLVAVISSFWAGRAALFSVLSHQLEAQSLKNTAALRTKPIQAMASIVLAEVRLYQAILGQDQLPETAAVLNVLRELPTIETQQKTTQELIEKALAQVLNRDEGNVFTTLTDASAEQQRLYTKLSVAQTQLQMVPKEFLSDKDKVIIDRLLEYVQGSRRQLATFEQFNQLLPSILAQDSKRRIAFLYQDSQELRPSGGTLQGVYLVTLENGKLIDQQFYDPAKIDSQKVGQLQAPADYQKYFDQKEIPFVDAGWSPDFTSTALTVSNYLDRNISRKPDIVVGITNQTLQKLIAEQGQVQVKTPPELITTKNFNERLELHPEPEFLREIYTKVIERSLSEPNQAMIFLNVLSQDLQSGQAFVVSTQETENGVLNSLGWAGQISVPQCPSQLGTDSCQVSSVYQLESNVGANKVNASIQRSITHDVRLTPTEAHHQRTMTFTNTASSTRWPLGMYRNYVRLYLPKDVVVSAVKIGNKDVDLATLDKGESTTGQFVGVIVDVPIESTQALTIEYTQPFNYNSSKAFAFFDQKQAGTPADIYTLSISPDGLQPTIIAPKAELRQGKIIFAQPRDHHQFVGVKFR